MYLKYHLTNSETVRPFVELGRRGGLRAHQQRCQLVVHDEVQ
jgi:hypothetical protein